MEYLLQQLARKEDFFDKEKKNRCSTSCTCSETLSFDERRVTEFIKKIQY